VNSPVRAFRSVGCDPLIIERGEGQYLYDVDRQQAARLRLLLGARCCSGHANPGVTAAIAEQAKRGTSFGVTTELDGRTSQPDQSHHSRIGKDSLRFKRHRSHD